MTEIADGAPAPAHAAPVVQWSPDVLPHWRALARLRTQLFPYVWAASQEYQRTGLPIMRSDDPYTAVVYGAGKALDDLDLLKQVSFE